MAAPSRRVPVMTVVHAPACHFCDDAERALAELAREFPLLVHVVELDSVEGQALLRRHRPALNPLVLVDGVFFSQGRLPRRKLRALPQRRAAGVTAGSCGRRE